MKLLQNILSFILMFIWFGIFSIFGLIIASSELQAKDFGIQGHNFAILEKDFLDVIGDKIQKIDWDEFNQKAQTKLKEHVERPASVTNIEKAKETKEYFYDPTYVLTQDIRDHNNQLLHPIGTKINPLEFVPLREALLFIDGDDALQVKFAIKQYAEFKEELKIILVKGAPLKLQREHKEQKIWVYFDQGGILTSKLNIREVPALVTQEDLKLKIKIFGNKL